MVYVLTIDISILLCICMIYNVHTYKTFKYRIKHIMILLCVRQYFFAKRKRKQLQIMILDREKQVRIQIVGYLSKI